VDDDLLADQGDDLLDLLDQHGDDLLGQADCDRQRRPVGRQRVLGPTFGRDLSPAP
jgi:hypothetical protein